MSRRLDPGLWKRVEPVLDRALDLEGAEREAYLAGVFSAEPELRAEVEALLEADEADGVLDRPIELPGQPPSQDLQAGVEDADSAEPRDVGPYRLLREIGSGGMGVVYEAEDLRLHRRVALKFLPLDQTPSESQLARFQREAKGLARLNHPNIVTLYSVEEHGGLPFITMELVEGVTLASHVPAEGLPMGRCLEYAIALVDALVAAHRQDIVHRDLKPANVMVTDDGRVKVLDFGLAKLVVPSPARDSHGTTEYKTAAGAVIGTVPYMSPEQLEGKEVDHRTDLFSFGAVLYEMATGQRPFDGDSSASIISAILRDDPQAPSELRRDLPQALGRIIDRCLEKKVDRRYESAVALRTELDELKQRLDSDSVVASRSRVGPAKRSWLVAAALALLLGVSALGVWGVVLWRGRGEDRSQPPDPSRAASSEATSLPPDLAQLEEAEGPPLTENLEAYFEYLRGIQATSGTWEWERFLRAVGHFERAVELDPDFAKAWAKLSITRAMAVSNGQYSPEDREAMVEASEREASRALELAPDDPICRLTRGYHAYYFRRDYDGAHQLFVSVLEEHSGDLETDAFLARAMGAIQRRRGDYEDSLRYFERALSLEPNDIVGAAEAARTHLAARGHARAASILDRVLVEEPDSAGIFVTRAWVEIKGTGSLERARTFLEQSPGGDAAMVELSRYERDWPRYLAALDQIEPGRQTSGLGVWHVLAGFAHRQLGNEEEARRHFESALEISEKLFLEAGQQVGNAPVLRGLALAYLGRSDEAVRLADTLPQLLPRGDRFTGPRVGEIKAEILAAAGEAEYAIDQIERMLSTSYTDALTVWDLRLDPIWDPLRDHPRLQALVAETE